MHPPQDSNGVPVPIKQDESEPSWVPTVTPLVNDFRSLTAPPAPAMLTCADPLPMNTTSAAPAHGVATTSTTPPDQITTKTTQPEPPTSSLEQVPTNNHQMVTRAKNKIVKQNPKYSYSAHLVLASLDPHTVTQALKDPLWRDSAMSFPVRLMRKVVLVTPRAMARLCCSSRDSPLFVAAFLISYSMLHETRWSLVGWLISPCQAGRRESGDKVKPEVETTVKLRLRR
ncbi:hypothetical protein YC2023_109314 [Brassica napus]